VARAKELHPDKGGAASAAPFRALQAAYDELRRNEHWLLSEATAIDWGSCHQGGGGVGRAPPPGIPRV
jgi:hypothetical protein